ncbi:MAG: nuclear transport factor 2 family protein [Caldilineaceae bacterium]
MSSLLNDQVAIRTARQAQNLAIAENDLDRVASFWTEDITIRRALGQTVEGQVAARQALQTTGDPQKQLVYQRHSTTIEVSEQWPLAFEEGSWAGHLGSVTGQVVIGGRYAAHWVKREGQWLIRSELFVALTCAAEGCKFQALP